MNDSQNSYENNNKKKTLFIFQTSLKKENFPVFLFYLGKVQVLCCFFLLNCVFETLSYQFYFLILYDIFMIFYSFSFQPSSLPLFWCFDFFSSIFMFSLFFKDKKIAIKNINFNINIKKERKSNSLNIKIDFMTN